MVTVTMKIKSLHHDRLTVKLSSVLNVVENSSAVYFSLVFTEDNGFNAEQSRRVVHGIQLNLEPNRQLYLFYFFSKIYIFLNLFYPFFFGCVGSSLLCTGFL